MNIRSNPAVAVALTVGLAGCADGAGAGPAAASGKTNGNGDRTPPKNARATHRSDD